MTYLSAHFTLEELLASSYAVRNGIDNTPTDDEVFANLNMLAAGLERVRDVLSLPIHVDSGFRCPKLNTACKGARDSAHLEGRAADIICPAFGTPQEVAEALAAAWDHIAFDTLIMEGNWCHVDFADAPRHRLLTAHFGSGPTTYTTGIS